MLWMNTMVFDTNVLVYAARDDNEFHDACKKRIAEASSEVTGLLTWNICYEFFRVVTHAQVSTQPWRVTEAQLYVAGLLDTLGFRLLLPTSRHMAVLVRTIAELPDIRGSRVHDMHTAILMREHGITQICTLDGDFRRFPFLEIVNPLE